VAGTVGATDLLLNDLGTGAAVPTESIRASYDAASRTVTFTLPGFAGRVLPNGNYRATLAAAGVHDRAANRLAAEGATEFFVLTGDINRDRSVNGSDFSILASNFGKTARAFADGDLNGDGSVDGSDFSLLASNFGRSVPPVTVPPPGELSARATAGATAPASARPDPATAPLRRRTPAPSVPARRPVHGKRSILDGKGLPAVS
jgi:hypothetical protein